MEYSEEEVLYQKLSQYVKEGDCIEVGNIFKIVPADFLCRLEKPEILAVSDSLLHIAATEGHEDVVNVLLKNGSNVNAAQMYGETPLHKACRRGSVRIIETLINAGAEIDYKDCGECTPLFHAVFSDQQEAVKYLIDAGCDLDTLNEELITPFDHAVLNSQKQVMSILIKGGCMIDRSMGLIHDPHHYCNNIVYELWANEDIANLRLLIDSGYVIRYESLKNFLALICRLLQPHQRNDRYIEELYDIIHRPKDLSNICRISIRQQILMKRHMYGGTVNGMIRELKLPRKLTNFLIFNDG